jgi:hypothetical protein
MPDIGRIDFDMLRQGLEGRIVDLTVAEPNLRLIHGGRFAVFSNKGTTS